MRITLAIAEDILRDLNRIAHKSGRSMTQVANQALRAGLAAMEASPKRKSRYIEQTLDMGLPTIDLTKALSLAPDL